MEVNNCYMRHYSRVFKPTEICMMLAAFSNMETIHIAAYSHLLDTLGMPEVEYSAFMKYKEMKDKFDYMQNASMKSRRDIAKTMAMFGAFTEGLQLFASFAILMNFPRFNKMKGMGQIITWSVRDETLHCLSMIKLFNSFINEVENLTLIFPTLPYWFYLHNRIDQTSRANDLLNYLLTSRALVFTWRR